MPGPPGTESRWPPAITTRSPLPPGVSAMTFWLPCRGVLASTSTSTRVPSGARPSAESATSTTGMRMPWIASVPLGTPRAVSERSTTTSALAPARCALPAFEAKKQTPRSTTGTSSSARPVKSSAAQPLRRCWSLPLAFPEPE